MLRRRQGKTQFPPRVHSQSSWHQLCMFSTPRNSNTNHLELVQTPQVKGSVPQDRPLLMQTSIANSRSAMLVWLGYRSEVPTSPSLNLIICSNSSQNSGKCLLTLNSLLYKEGHEKRYRWTAGRRDTEVRSGRDPRTGASVPVGLRCASLPVHRRVHWPGSSANHTLRGSSWKPHHVGTMGH